MAYFEKLPGKSLFSLKLNETNTNWEARWWRGDETGHLAVIESTMNSSNCHSLHWSVMFSVIPNTFCSKEVELSLP